MTESLDQLLSKAVHSIQQATELSTLEQVRLQYLSKKGLLQTWTEKLKEIPKEQRPCFGKKLNEVKSELERSFEEKKSELESAQVTAHLDLTLPGRPYSLGRLHPITQTIDQIVSIFRRMGFAIEDGPDIETEFYNFDALNTPQDHPARNENDTFYVNIPPHPEQGRYLLRTQTSPVQVRAMQSRKPPIRIICPGRCYRRDEIDATHGTSFYQIEGLVVDEKVTLSDLKGSLEFFFKELLGVGTQVRFRPHFFPFTEPSFEVDFSHPKPKSRAKQWLEIAGCGMVDPNVFHAAGYNPEHYSGFAFGMGVERIAMIIHDIPDLRLFEQNDIRFLKQW